MKRRQLLPLFLAAAAGQSRAQADFPSRPIKILVPQPPGGGFYFLARTLAEHMGRGLNQSVVVENKPGSGTLVGTDAAAKAAADGYTLLVGSVSNMVLNSGLYPSLPYEPVRDFEPVGNAVAYSYTLMARHLHAAGHRVTAHEPAPERHTLAAARGLAVASELPAVLSASSLVLSSLPSDAALAVVAEAMATHAPAGAVWVDTSTVSPAASRKAAARCAARGVACVRAPVSGNNTMAERAALTVFASGDRTDCDAVEPLLACWGPQRFYLGAGKKSKLPSWR